MQNKGFVKFLAIALTLICLYYLSFSVATNHYDRSAAKMGEVQGKNYLDSLATKKVWLGNTLAECREKAIGLGLDLKGGMNVVLEVSAPDVLKALSGNKQDADFLAALAEANKESENSQSNFVDLFAKAYKAKNPNGALAQIFATEQLKDKVNPKTSDSDVIKFLKQELDGAIDNSLRVIRTRVDRFGVVQPNIQKIEGQNRIMVELPGIKDQERVRKLLQGSANLEFWVAYRGDEVVNQLSNLNSYLRTNPLSDDATAEADTAAAAAPADSAAVEEPIVAKNEPNAPADSAKKESSLVAKAEEGTASEEADELDMAEMKKQNPLFSMLVPMQDNSGAVYGFYAQVTDTAEINRILNSPQAKRILPSDARWMWDVASMDEAGRFFNLYAIKTSSGVNGQAPLTGDMVTEAKDSYDQFGKPVVSMSMNTEGTRKWATLTEQNVGKPVAIVLDNLVYSAPNINEKISGGQTQISGHFTIEQTKDLANVLSSGKMPAPARIVQEDIVGPSLGAESIKAGFISFIIAFIVLMIYMCMMYGFRAGMVANGALILNFFFTLGILTSLQAALTMSGIAGMVLTLGMAVDANVLIYERAKEELRAGKQLKSAVAAGYSNAFSAIFDSNLTSIITGVILYYFGTGPIRGFATTLIIGIICSFFTAVWLTRIVYEHQFARDKWQDLTFVTNFSKNLMQGTKYNFMGIYKRSFAIFGVLILASLISFAVRGLSRSIDFTGGRNYRVEFAEPVKVDDVRSALQKAFAAKSEEGNDAVTVAVTALGTEGKTMRISTNYLIKSSAENVDTEIEQVLYDALASANLIDGNSVSRDDFVNRDADAVGAKSHITTSQKVGPSIASDITRGAIISVILALVAIFLYILLRFRNVAFSIGSITALVIDTLLIIGMYSLCYGWIGFSLEIDQTFIGAILTAIGYSINDKVVVFDRIRENLKLYPKRDKQRLFNESLNSTLARTINTSVSTFIVLLAIFIFGGDSIRSFAFAMILGVIFGTCSSLFIAAPVAYLVMGRQIKEDGAVEPATEKK